MYFKLVKLESGFIHFCEFLCKITYRIIEAVQEIGWYNWLVFLSINLIAVTHEIIDKNN